MRKFVVLVVLLLLLAVTVAPSAAQTTGTVADVIASTAAAAEPDLTTLQTALQTANLTATLAGPGPYTVFAPTDAAFGGLPSNITVDGLLADPEYLNDVLLYHVVSGNLPASQLAASTTLSSLEGLPLRIRVDEDGTIFVNSTAQIITADIPASNGVVHIISDILIPPYEVNTDDLALALGDAAVVSEPGGDATGALVRRCQTFFFDFYSEGYYRLANIGGWVDARIFYDVGETYGQPGGQATFPGC